MVEKTKKTTKKATKKRKPFFMGLNSQPKNGVFFQQIYSLQTNLNEIKPKDDKKRFDNSSNLINIGFDELSRNPYANYQYQKTLQSLSFLAENESIAPINLYHYFIEIAVKNNGFLQAVINNFIEKKINNVKFIFLADETTKELNDEINDYWGYVSLMFNNIALYTLLYGGCYVVIEDDIKYFAPNEIIIKEKYVYRGVTVITDSSFKFKPCSKLQKLNTYLKAKQSSICEEKILELKKLTGLERVSFDNGNCVALLDNIFLINSHIEPYGSFTKQLLQGINLSILEGKANLLASIYNDIMILLDTIKTKNRIVAKIKDYEPLTAYGSMGQIARNDKILKELSITQSNDILLTDVNNEVSVLQQNEMSYKDIVNNFLLSLTDVLFETNISQQTYKKTVYESREEQTQVNKQNVNKHISSYYCSQIKQLYFAFLEKKITDKNILDTIKKQIIFSQQYE